jgi:hypothetical protein
MSCGPTTTQVQHPNTYAGSLYTQHGPASRTTLSLCRCHCFLLLNHTRHALALLPLCLTLPTVSHPDDAESGRQSSPRAELDLETTEHPTFVLNAEGKVVLWNSKAAVITGAPHPPPPSSRCVRDPPRPPPSHSQSPNEPTEGLRQC